MSESRFADEETLAHIAELEAENARLREELAASERTREGLVKFYAGAVADAKRYRYLVEHLGDIEGALSDAIDAWECQGVSPTKGQLDAAIDAAVLDARGEQEPVAEIDRKVIGMLKIVSPDEFVRLPDGTKLFAAPVVQPNMVMVPQEVIDKIEQWSRAYPTDVFPEPDFEKVREALEGSDITLDAVSASNMRHVITEVWKMIAAAEGKG